MYAPSDTSCFSPALRFTAVFTPEIYIPSAFVYTISPFFTVYPVIPSANALYENGFTVLSAGKAVKSIPYSSCQHPSGVPFERSIPPNFTALSVPPVISLTAKFFLLSRDFGSHARNMPAVPETAAAFIQSLKQSIVIGISLILCMVKIYKRAKIKNVYLIVRSLYK